MDTNINANTNANSDTNANTGTTLTLAKLADVEVIALGLERSSVMDGGFLTFVSTSPEAVLSMLESEGLHVLEKGAARDFLLVPRWTRWWIPSSVALS